PRVVGFGAGGAAVPRFVERFFDGWTVLHSGLLSFRGASMMNGSDVECPFLRHRAVKRGGSGGKGRNGVTEAGKRRQWKTPPSAVPCSVRFACPHLPDRFPNRSWTSPNGCGSCVCGRGSRPRRA